jgi:tetratricopeptide (TPR) repeat protein
MASPLARPATRLPGFDDELARTEADIAGVLRRLEAHPRDLEQRLRLAYRLFHRASLTGRMEHFTAAEATVCEILDDFGPKEDLCLLKANLDLRFHRLPQARLDLEMCPLLPGRFEGRVLLADLDFQEGHYEAARRELEQLIDENRTWDNLARLAHWHSKLGDPVEADRLWVAAEDELTAKQMRAFAWLELQRGLLAFMHGDYRRTRQHYDRAEEAYPGHWHTDEHVAELMAAEGELAGAAALLRQVIVRVGKPELEQALGEMYLLAHQPEEAAACFDRALRTYLESAQRGEVHYFHHLVDFYTDAQENIAEAVAWARRDIELRSNFSTQAAMAWALYRNHQLNDAMGYIRQALASGVRDARIFSVAATLFAAAGERSESQNYAMAAVQINPKYRNFHMHH